MSIFDEVFKAIDRGLGNHTRFIVAIEGNSGTGKSHLSQLLSKRYDCNVFHMDDFFLQMHQRTPERFQEAGGNVDYERFNEEVIMNLESPSEFKYQIFDCSEGELTEYVAVTPKKLNIIEGVYSMHPLWNSIIDFKIFLRVDSEVQLDRIRRRNGEFMLERFQSEWIPLENKYFEAHNIKENCDLIIDTGA